MYSHEHRQTIIQLAREMAQSGRYRGWRAIEAHLRADGLSGVREALNDDALRHQLDDDCRGRRHPV